ITVLAVGLVAVVPQRLARRVPILLGGLIAYAIYLVLANGFGLGKPIDFAALGSSPWFGLPNFSTPVFDAKAMALIAPVAIVLVAALFAVVLGFSPKFGALILTIPGPVIGGLSIVVFGLIAATAGRIWVENKVDFASARNLLTVGVALVIGAGDLAIKLGG